MSSTAQRRDQRRRLLMSWTRAAAPAADAAAGATARTLAPYAPDAQPERQRGPAVLLPTGLGGVALAAAAIVVPMLGAAAIGGWETWTGRPLIVSTGRFARTLATLSACCDPRSPASLQGWLAQAWLLVAAIVALVVRLMRRHRRDDYRGRYRAWGWVAGLLATTALAGTVPVGPLVGAVVADSSGIVLGPHGIGWWLVLAATAWCLVAVWAVVPLHERTGSAIWLGLALGAWGGAAAVEWLGAGRDAWIVGGRVAWTTGAGLAATAMLVAARSVIREVRGEAAARATRHATAARRPATRSPVTVPEVDAVAGGFDQAGAAAVAEADDEAATDFVDGSEQEHRHLSKAERKRLKKLARMKQAVA